MKDEELEVILQLKHIRSLSFHATEVTDAGLKHLEALPELQELWMDEASQVTDTALDQLRQSRPNLKIDLPYRDHREGQ